MYTVRRTMRHVKAMGYGKLAARSSPRCMNHTDLEVLTRNSLAPDSVPLNPAFDPIQPQERYESLSADWPVRCLCRPRHRLPDASRVQLLLAAPAPEVSVRVGQGINKKPGRSP